MPRLQNRAVMAIDEIFGVSKASHIDFFIYVYDELDEDNRLRLMAWECFTKTVNWSLWKEDPDKIPKMLLYDLASFMMESRRSEACNCLEDRDISLYWVGNIEDQNEVRLRGRR